LAGESALESLFIKAPGFHPRVRPRVFAEGSRYERRVLKELLRLGLGARLHLSPWLAGPCQPDAILEFSTSLLVVESKLSACDARRQTAKYARALAPAAKQVWVVQIAKNVSPSFPPTIESLWDIKNSYEILHWWL